ncbi:MAG: alpha-ketoacid dehydrogenase subunit beta [Candidatus Tectomicrobia bacterium]|nr:alpha-ketoacid dehydrogenase subunit beta [Candidatus Tectomicrobia bacterium]
MRVIDYGRAITEALAEEMERDEGVHLLGEDIGIMGGVFGITRGLQAKFGIKRVIDTPISELAIVGDAIGAALNGLRPVAEIQFSDFLTCGFSQIIDVLAPHHYRSGMNVPLVIRAPVGGGFSGGMFHSKCPEAWVFHVPGLKIAVPSTPYDAKGLLKAAIRDDDPVVYFEHKYLYRRIRGEVPEEDYTVPLGQADVKREGRDITVITYGWMVHIALEAANLLSKEGIELEIIDLRTLCPLDTRTFIESFKKTNRAIVFHEAQERGGVGGEIVSILVKEAFEYIAAPPLRLAPPHTPVPFSPPLEQFYLPKAEQLVEMARGLMGY